MTNTTTVYALIVGINDYPTAPLSGCVSDAKKMLAFLKQDPSLDVREKALYDKEATKHNIVQALRTHLSLARAGDVAFFYYSGHGAQERADEQAWATESDRRLECLACYDASGMASLLADKELRYLIREVAAGTPENPKAEAPHILTIFDCCHSGDNTRSAAFQEKEPAVRQKRFTHVFPMRQWKDFIFADRLKEEDFIQRPIAELLPEGKHVQLAAALDNQPALEIGNEGLFTRNLIKVLENSGGSISYASTHSLVSNYIRHQYQQNPQLYVQGGSPEVIFSGFLGKEVRYDGQALGQVQYSKSKGWLLNLGAMHGISSDTELEIIVDENTSLQATIEKVEPNETFLDIDFEQRSMLDKEQAYSCKVAAFSAYPIQLMLKDEEGDEALFEELENALKGHDKRIQRTDKEAEADYLLHIRFGMLFITPPFQHYYPLAYPVDISNAEKPVDAIIRQVDHIAKWEYVRQLHNENVKLFKKAPLKVQVHYEKDGAWVPLNYLEKGEAVDGMEWMDVRNTYRSKLKIELTNEFNRDLYYSLLFLTVNFESSTGLMEKPVELIRAGETITIFSHKGGIIPFLLEQQILDYNVPETKLWFKIIINTQPEIDTARLSLNELSPPPVVFKTRGIPTGDEDLSLVQSDDWTTMLIPLTFKNPRHNRISKERLMGMLWEPGQALQSRAELMEGKAGLRGAFEELDKELLEKLDPQSDARTINKLLGNNIMTPFAAGIYLESEGLSGKLKLRHDIEILEEGAAPDMVKQKGLFWDVLLKAANTYGRTVRLVDFERRVKKYPRRTLMVSEGDSWFQHPAIREIIDHLSLNYNIYSRGAAGDEMRDYLMTGDYLDSIHRVMERMAPHEVEFFLISGGGNDILGEQFKEFLNPFAEVEELEEGEKPQRFLNQKFRDEMEAIMGLYEMVFRRIQTEFPKLRIITHGYDYPIPKGVDESGMSWLGEPMTKQGITRPKDRQGIVSYLIDEFNGGLMALAEQFPMVAHVDVRNTVKPYQWADEIHPNSEGYQNVALCYMKVIDQIIQENK